MVIEKNPREDDFDETQTDCLIPMADLVAITGTALTNHTIERLLSFCRPEAFVILLGDTAPLLRFFSNTVWVLFPVQKSSIMIRY